MRTTQAGGSVDGTANDIRAVEPAVTVGDAPTTSAPASNLRSRRGRLTLGATALIGALALTGCQWTSTIQTDQSYDPADGFSVTLGGLELANVLVVSPGKGQPGHVSALAINHTNAPLQVSVRMADTDNKTSPVTVPAQGALPLTTPGGASMTIAAVPEPAGALIPLVITTSQGETTLQAPILPPTGVYAGYGPATPTPSATASPSATPSATAATSESANAAH